MKGPSPEKLSNLPEQNVLKVTLVMEVSIVCTRQRGPRGSCGAVRRCEEGKQGGVPRRSWLPVVYMGKLIREIKGVILKGTWASGA